MCFLSYLEEKQDLSLSISSNGSASITVSLEVNGIVYSGVWQDYISAKLFSFKYVSLKFANWWHFCTGSLYAQKSSGVPATPTGQSSTVNPSIPSSSKGSGSTEPAASGST